MYRTVWVRFDVYVGTQAEAERKVDEAIKDLPFDTQVIDDYDMADYWRE